jgi:hypothetical protein
MKLEKALKSKALYYVALVLMVVNVLGYVSVGSVECIIVFAVTYYLSNSYTKNQSLDILVGLFVANVIFGCGRVREGFEEGAASKADKLASEASKADQNSKVLHNAASKCDPKSGNCYGQGNPTKAKKLKKAAAANGVLGHALKVASNAAKAASK